MPNQILMQMLLSKLQAKNPQAYNLIAEAKNNGTNPMNMLQQVMKGSTPEQKEALIKQGEQYGVPKNILSQIQNMK